MMMEKLKITAGGRELTLRWDVEAWLELEDAGHPIEEIVAKTKSDTPHRAWLVFAAALCNSGQRHDGKDPDITPEWLSKNLTPKELRIAEAACILAYLMGEKRSGAEDDDEETDAVLEELKKKTKSTQVQDDA